MIAFFNIWSLFIFLFFFNSTILFSQCEEFKSESISKINQVILDLEGLKQPSFLSSSQLLSVIYPELATYSKVKNEAELAYLNFNYTLNNDRYKSISFGPFQMQLSFIDKYLSENQNLIKGDSILCSYSRGNYKFLINNINYLNQIKVQWKILLAFEQSILNKYKIDDSDLNYSFFINIYNSGKPENNNLVFSKIKCLELTYEHWCYKIQNWINGI